MICGGLRMWIIKVTYYYRHHLGTSGKLTDSKMQDPWGGGSDESFDSSNQQRDPNEAPLHEPEKKAPFNHPLQHGRVASVLVNTIAWRIGSIVGSHYRFLKNTLNYLVYTHFLNYGGFIKVIFLEIWIFFHSLSIRYYVITKNTL